MLRRFIYFDHYAALDPEWANAPLLREHTDHCLDMLRELLMCRADTTLITYHWRKGFSGPVPDFSTRVSSIRTTLRKDRADSYSKFVEIPKMS